MIITAYDDYVNEAGCSVNLLELVSTYRNKKVLTRCLTLCEAGMLKPLDFHIPIGSKKRSMT